MWKVRKKNCAGLEMKFAYRSPMFFSHGGIFLNIWGKWYRIVKVGPK